MKVITLAIFGQMLFASVFTASAVTNQGKQKILESFVKRQILYDVSTPLDSVILWSEQLLPSIQADEHKDKEVYFLLQLQLANAYTLRGDVGLATDLAQLMYEGARNLNYQFGIVVANQAIGDAYNTIADLYDKALESYQDALSELSLISSKHPYRTRLLLKISNVLQRKGCLEEAHEILNELKDILQQKPDYPTEFFFNIEKANYAISHGHLSQNYLDEAAGHLYKTDSIYKKHPERFYRFHLDYTTAAYYRAMGNWNKQYWEKALNIYSKLQEEYANNKRSTYYRWTSLEKIYLYKIQGMSMEACHIYQELYPPIDTLAAQSYIRQINAIKAKYQVDKLAVASNEEYNKIVSSITIGSIIILVLFSLLAVRLRTQREKVVLSTRKLALSRANAENATRAKSVFLSNMSHEIRTPLNALSGFSSLLMEDGLDSETRRQCNEVIQQNSELLLKLINDVIDLSSLEFGKLQFSIKRHDAICICQNVVDTVSKVKQTQAEVSFATNLKEMIIETDDSRLQQVLINLLINATKFTPEGSIVLELKQEAENMIFFSVTDTGCGIPQNKQATIFQRFEKLNENMQGSGLGLSICQLIIEHIGGKIWIDPDYKQGSRFCFTHPINQTCTSERKETEI
ncbi:ATP-binding protein [Bacteroides helcogenes]|uniref:histidine kinase n=1 Tax=Bacteroides helcogenes (strain ATCC 35417 / DSM 20613 / JCM 6297 / CCUG 15421 / P 36-108) TaxID=693979 RepID=E6STB0_BACT6|nr:ATP-binding protein [Bacteroides helcogenes]ADV42241.1 histidine kinase [Bacteroides helcogenes P 36-108]MDY5237306.1 ATP-binding protein [Bacteroides helcogenes]